MKYHHARLSTDDQNPALQLPVSKKAGCQTLFKYEGSSGAATKRSALFRCRKCENSTRLAPAGPDNDSGRPRARGGKFSRNVKLPTTALDGKLRYIWIQELRMSEDWRTSFSPRIYSHGL